jgi:hypothetical protein
VDRAEQRGAGGGEGDEVVLCRGARRRLLGRLGDPAGERCARDGVGQCRQPGHLGGLRTQQPGDERLVTGVHRGEGVVDAGDGLGQQVGPHHTTALVGGNQCISGSGAVVAGSSR